MKLHGPSIERTECRLHDPSIERTECKLHGPSIQRTECKLHGPSIERTECKLHGPSIERTECKLHGPSIERTECKLRGPSRVGVVRVLLHGCFVGHNPNPDRRSVYRRKVKGGGFHLIPSVLHYVHRDQNLHLDFYTAPELCGFLI